MNFHTELSHIDHRQLPNILIKEKKKTSTIERLKNKYSLITLKSLEEQKILWSISRKNFVSDY